MQKVTNLAGLAQDAATFQSGCDAVTASRTSSTTTLPFTVSGFFRQYICSIKNFVSETVTVRHISHSVICSCN